MTESKTETLTAEVLMELLQAASNASAFNYTEIYVDIPTLHALIAAAEERDRYKAALQRMALWPKKNTAGLMFTSEAAEALRHG